MKTEHIKLTHMRNDEHFQFLATFIRLVYEITPEVLKILKQFTAFLTLFGQEDEALKKIVKSALTEDIRAADRLRDAIFSGMVEANKSALKHFKADVKAAAKRLKILFDTYGNVAAKPMNEETSAIYNLLQELNGNYAQDVALVGFSEWVTELTIANAAFDNLMAKRYDEAALKSELVLRQVRLKVDAAYRDIIKRIEAMYLLDELDVHKDFIHKLNIVIEKYNVTIAERMGRHQANDEHEKKNEE